METTTLSKMCKKCAKCCRRYSFVALSQNDIDAIEKFTGLHFDVFTNPKGKASEGYFLKFNKNGDCFFLDKHNDNYSCRVYETRSQICKNYPSNPSQHETCNANRNNTTLP